MVRGKSRDPRIVQSNGVVQSNEDPYGERLLRLDAGQVSQRLSIVRELIYLGKRLTSFQIIQCGLSGTAPYLA